MQWQRPETEPAEMGDADGDQHGQQQQPGANDDAGGVGRGSSSGGGGGEAGQGSGGLMEEGTAAGEVSYDSVEFWCRSSFTRG